MKTTLSMSIAAMSIAAISIVALSSAALFISFTLCMALRPAIDAPATEITNGLIKAQLLLPDAQNGYYRGTRFDWSGVVASLEYKGHSYHGQWFDTYSPTLHDAIMGPVDEFGQLGYADASVGGTFVKIGVGTLTRPDDKPYNAFTTYPIVNGGKWQVKKKADQVQFRQTLDDSMYAYDYQKTLKLTKGKPELVITHSLKNTGKRVIETTSYNHNFFVIDQQPTGPTYVVTFPVSNLSTEGGRGAGELVSFQDNKLVYLRDLAKREQAYFPNLAAGKPIRYDLTVDNTKPGAGVHITGDQEISRMVYWSSSTTICPEPYIAIRVEPGKTFSWQIIYQYYTKE